MNRRILRLPVPGRNFADLRLPCVRQRFGHGVGQLFLVPSRPRLVLGWVRVGQVGHFSDADRLEERLIEACRESGNLDEQRDGRRWMALAYYDLANSLSPSQSRFSSKVAELESVCRPPAFQKPDFAGWISAAAALAAERGAS